VLVDRVDLPFRHFQDLVEHPLLVRHFPAGARIQADDHAVVRQGLRMFLALEPEFEIVGEAPMEPKHCAWHTNSSPMLC
jgi:hypothetical protein